MNLCRGLFLVMFIVAAAGFLSGQTSPGAAPQKPGVETLFRSTNLLRVSLTISPEGVQILRGSRGRRSEIKPKATATVFEGGRTYSNVTVQLKGFTSFQPIDARPALTLHFDKGPGTQSFHGLSKLSLNNSVQDPTRLHEKLARELFVAAGVPAPRSDHALVTLNGRDLGLYVLVEGYDQKFLAQHFKRSDGNLYEGGVLQDIDRPLQVTRGKHPENQAAIDKLLRAAREPDPRRRFELIAAAVDMDRFLSMIAVETILCHSDSYSMNRNNYRIYHDPASDKLVFMPHGMDQIFGTHRSPLDLAIVPPMLGLVARAVLSTPKGRAQYLDRFELIFNTWFRSDLLCRRVHQIETKIRQEKLSRPFEARFGRGGSPGQDAEALCARIRERIADITLQLAHPELHEPYPCPVFNAAGNARLSSWTLRPKAGWAESTSKLVTREGKEWIQVQSRQKPLQVSLRNRFALPIGRYSVTGQILMDTAPGAARSLWVNVVRYSSGRFGAQRQMLEPRELNVSFEVTPALAPEEFELVCELRTDAEEAWIDASTLRLVRH